jgi:integrase
MKIDKHNADAEDEPAVALADDADDEYFLDDADAAEEEFGVVIADSGNSLKGAKSVLLQNLNTCPSGDFHVSEGSLYQDSEWRLTGGNVVKFASEISGVNDLKRSILFHLLPEYHPWGTVKSSHTTHSLGYVFVHIERYIFSDNKLNATKHELKALDATKLNEALDKAKASGFVALYRNVYFFVRLWLQLSAQKLIPEQYRLNVAINLVDTKERRKDVIRHIKSEVGSYKPLSEEELAKLIDYALFWTEHGIPALKKVAQFLRAEGIDDGHNVIRISSPSRAQNYIDKLTFPNDIKEVFEPKVIFREQIVKKSRLPIKIWDIYWVRPYAAALDSIRKAIFIWLALITGARKRELGVLTADDIIYNAENDEYTIRITRFKTTDDPDFGGKEDILPLPKYIGDIVFEYAELRNIRKFSAVKSLFGSHQHSRLGQTQTATNAYKCIDEMMAQIQGVLGLEEVHCHRFRKTIAEILINRDERNIDIIRLLFGHTSYAMTLRYIARNPYLVRGVVQAIEKNYTADFADILSGITSGVYAGDRAGKLAGQLDGRELGFLGKTIKSQIYDYVSHRIQSGQPLFVHRTSLGVGTYCLSTDNYAGAAKPPCIAAHSFYGSSSPNPKNCHIECDNLVLLEKAIVGLRQNIAFYTRLVDSHNLNEKALNAVSNKLNVSEHRLLELESRADSNKEAVSLIWRASS